MLGLFSFGTLFCLSLEFCFRKRPDIPRSLHDDWVNAMRIHVAGLSF